MGRSSRCLSARRSISWRSKLRETARAARQGQRGRLRLRAVDDSRRLRRVEAVQGRAGHEQRRDQHARLRGQRDGRPREQLRPRRRDRLLRGHRARRRLRALGHQPRRDRPGAVLPHAGPTPRQPRRPHHRPGDAHHAHELRRRPVPAARARMRRWRSPTPSATRSWPGSWCIATSWIGTSPSSAARPTIGYGLSDDDPRRGRPDRRVTWDDYVAFLADYTPGARPGAVRACRRRASAGSRRSTAIRARKVMSVWGTEVNQDVRGTWMNNLLYNIHLLVGKVASPGNSPFCTTGQPSGGSAVHDAGTLTHTLPRGVVQARRTAAAPPRSGGCRWSSIDPRPTHSALSMFRALDRGDIRFLWIQATNPMVSLPNLSRYRRAAAQGRSLHRRLGGVPHADDRRGRRGPARGDVDRARRACSRTWSGARSTSSGWSCPPATRRATPGR